MLRAYHQKMIDLAEAAVATGRPATIYLAMAKAASVWIIPAIIGILVCSCLGLVGPALLYICLPLIAVTIAGGCGYIGWIYWRAMMRGH